MKKDIKIVGVISSSRFNGNTATIVREALKAANREGAEVIEVFLPKYNIGFCKGCLKCTEEGKCPISDDFEEIRKLIYEADGIILGSPTYAGEYNAIMKCFLERLGPYTLYASLLGEKYGAAISTAYDKNSAKKVAKSLTGIFKFGIFERSYVSGFLGAGTRHDGVEIRVNESIDDMKKANDLGIKIVRDIKNENKYPLQNLIMRFVIALKIQPIFKKYILKNKDGKEGATYKQLAKRGLI